MALQPWRVGKIIRIQDETSDTRRFWFEVPEVDLFDFQPGQFVTLDLPIHEKPNKRWRSYSISSWPNETNVFELVIVLDKTGAGTPYLFDQISVGSEISFRGPQGVFTLKEPLDKDIFMICTGTGIAPFRSMIHHIKNNHFPHKNIYLIFGCRTKSSLLYYEELKKIQEELPGFYYIPTLSREQWDGNTGYVHAIYESLCRERNPANFFLCGWKGMIDDAKKTILEMGYDKKDIHLEIYG
ncbi:MAG: FAD-dependent oxidoreductase [Ferruginibacter sp.]|nr:FAD-dependent oxidoreductase [Ferruginibacter sp.]